MGSTTNIGKLIPKAMQNDFWLDFCQAWSDELELFKSDRATPKTITYNVRELYSLQDVDALKNVSSTFGYYPNVSLTPSDNASLSSFYKKEIESIAYRIKRKTTYTGYDFIFNSIPLLGYVYNMYFDGTELIRAMNYNNHLPKYLITNGDGSTTTFTFTYSKPSLYVNQSIKLYQNTTDLNVSASDNTIEILTTSPNVGSGTYVRATGLLTFTFTSPPAMGDNIFVELTINVDDTNLELVSYNFTDPFVYTLPEYYYSFVEDNSFTLDAGYSLDDGYVLDTSILKELTHHLMIETVPTALLNSTIDQILIATGDGSTTTINYTYSYPLLYVNQSINLFINSTSINISASDNAIEILTTTPNVGSGTYNRSTGQLSFTFTSPPNVSDSIYLQLDVNKYLMNNLYLDYIFYYVNKYNRKVTEIPHVGAQLCLVCDDSGYYDNLKPTKPDTYTVNSLKARLSTTLNYPGPDLNIEDIFYELVAGNGTQTMYNYGQTINPITSLNSQFFKRRLSFNESDDTGDYYKVNTYIPLNTIENLIIGTGDGSTINFSGTLSITNIIPKSFNLQYYANNLIYNISDDTGNGSVGPSSNRFVGTIDYDSGYWEFEFRNHVPATPENLAVVTSGTSSINATLSNVPIKLDTFTFIYSVTSGPITNQYVASSDALGNITSSFGIGHITSGTINTSGVVSITFAIAIDDTSVSASYDYYLYSVPTNGTDLTISYKTYDNVEITEVGILNKSGDLIVYSTIPPMDCPERNDYHLGLQYYIKK